MPSSTVDNLTTGSALTGTEKFYADNGSADTEVTALQIGTYAGSWVRLIAPTSFSGVSSTDINISSYSSYRAIKIIYYNLDCSAIADICIRTSDSGVSSFATGASDYHWAWTVSYSGGAFSDFDVTDSFLPIGFMSDATGARGYAELTLWNHTSTWVHYTWDMTCVSSGSLTTRVLGNGWRNATEVCQGVRLFPTTGTFDGTSTVLGLV